MPEALPTRLLISVSNDEFDATFEPRYTKFFTFSDIIDVDWMVKTK